AGRGGAGPRRYRPDDANLWELTVKVADNLEEEEATYREMIRLFPEEEKYPVLLGATLVDRGEHAKAREVLEGVAKKTSGTTRARADYHLARGSLNQGKPEKAPQLLEQAGQPRRRLV